MPPNGAAAGGIRNAALCAIGDGKAGDVLAVQKNLAAGGGRKAHDELTASSCRRRSGR